MSDRPETIAELRDELDRAGSRGSTYVIAKRAIDRLEEADSMLRDIAIQPGRETSYDGGHPWRKCRLCGVKYFGDGEFPHKTGCRMLFKPGEIYEP